MNISIIIPNFNGRELLEKNLPFVLKAKRNNRNNIKEVIIVDDCSNDDSVKFLKEQYIKKIKLVTHTHNQGFAASVNAGAKIAKSEFICLLNTDVIPSSNFLETIDEDFKNEQIFAVSLHEEGYGYAIGKFVNGFIVHEGKPEAQEIKETFWANGGSAVFRMNIWRELRGMDEELLSPFYWEDIDLSYRAQKRGYKVIWDPEAKVIHQHESTMKKLDQKYVTRIRERNHLLFIWKNLTSSNLLKKHTISVLKRILNHPGYLRVVLSARLKWRKLMELRRREIKESVVADEAIFEKFQH